MLHRKRVERLAKLFDTLPRKKFDMSVVAAFRDSISIETPSSKAMLHDCGTVGCIAGYANALARLPRNNWDTETAADWLGLGYFAGRNLFFDMTIHTPKQAAKRLRALLKAPEWEVNR